MPYIDGTAFTLAPRDVSCVTSGYLCHCVVSHTPIVLTQSLIVKCWGMIVVLSENIGPERWISKALANRESQTKTGSQELVRMWREIFLD